MESLGILLAIPVSGIISVFYSGGTAFLLNAFSWLRWPVLILSGIVVVNLGAEFVLLLSLGAKQAYSLLGVGFAVMHEINFFFASASVANFVLVPFAFWTREIWSRIGLSFLCATPVCWIMCMTMVLNNISVDEDIVGV